MKNTIEIRISALILISISLFFLPWWLYVAILLSYAVVYNPALEVIAFGFLTDQIYGVSYTYTLSASLMFLVVYGIKSQLRS